MSMMDFMSATDEELAGFGAKLNVLFKSAIKGPNGEKTSVKHANAAAAAAGIAGAAAGGSGLIFTTTKATWLGLSSTTIPATGFLPAVGGSLMCGLGVKSICEIIDHVFDAKSR